MSDGLFRLCERLAVGGSPGGGGGIVTPYCWTAGEPFSMGDLGVYALPRAPVDAARRDPGGSEALTACPLFMFSNCAVLCCKLSMAVGEVVLFLLMLIADKSLSAWFLDEDRARVPIAGGGGGNAPFPTKGEAFCAHGAPGDRLSIPIVIVAPPGDIVVAALLGVVP
jgi:hypothetical protein